MKKTLSTVLFLIIAFSSLLTCAGCSQNDMVVYTLSNDQTHYVVSGLDYDPDEKPTRLNLSIKTPLFDNYNIACLMHYGQFFVFKNKHLHIAVYYIKKDEMQKCIK